MRRFHGKLPKNYAQIFRQKRLVATRNENWADGLYLSYCPFTQLSERKQMTAFHEKSKEVFLILNLLNQLKYMLPRLLTESGADNLYDLA